MCDGSQSSVPRYKILNWKKNFFIKCGFHVGSNFIPLCSYCHKWYFLSKGILLNYPLIQALIPAFTPNFQTCWPHVFRYLKMKFWVTRCNKVWVKWRFFCSRKTDRSNYLGAAIVLETFHKQSSVYRPIKFLYSAVWHQKGVCWYRLTDKLTAC